MFRSSSNQITDLKRAIKEIEQELVPVLDLGKIGPLEVLIYCYLAPVKKFLNGKMQNLVLKIGEKLEIDNPDTLIKSQKQVNYSQSNAKLVRLNKGKEVLPVRGERNILITSALPYVNNVPHLGNIIGCVLSADVFARYCRLMGYNTLYICGTDEYGTATETKAVEENKTPQEICDHYFKIHKRIYEWFDCDFDHFGRTTTPQQTEISQKIFWDCHNNNFTYTDVTQQLFCTKCNRYLADRFVYGKCYMCPYEKAKGDQWDACGKLVNAVELIDPKCKVCDATPIVRESTHIFLDLSTLQEELNAWVDESSEKGKWSKNSLSTTKGWLKEGLKGRSITRDLKWGTPVPLEGFTDKVFYVWFDAPIGYCSITNTFTDNWERWWKNPDDVDLYQFMGKDNVPFHCVVFPSTLLATKDKWTLLHHISTTEYLNYEGGKFSKSEWVGVFGDQASEIGVSSEVWRYYLLSVRPESQDSTFDWNEFTKKNNNELIANIGNFCNRVLKLTYTNFEAKVPEIKSELLEIDTIFLDTIFEKLEAYFNSMEQVRIKESLGIAMSIASSGNKYLQDTEPFKIIKEDRDRCSTILNITLNALRIVLAIVEPFIPSFSAKIYEQLNLQRTERDEVFLREIRGKPSDYLLTLLKPGHQINEPSPVFKKISNAECESWRKKFAGKQN